MSDVTRVLSDIENGDSLQPGALPEATCIRPSGETKIPGMHNLAKHRCSTAVILVLIAAGIPGLLNAETTSNDWFSVVSILKHKQALNRAHDVELSGHLAFVPGKGGSIAIIDIAKPNAPKLLWHKEGLGDSETVLPIGNHLLLGTNDFYSMDISDPKYPLKLGSQKLPASNMNPDASYAKGKRKTDNAHDLITGTDTFL